jgi:hypothetical protein
MAGLTAEQIAAALKEARSRCRGPVEEHGCDAAIVLMAYTLRRENHWTMAQTATFAGNAGLISWPFGTVDY